MVNGLWLMVDVEFISYPSTIDHRPFLFYPEKTKGSIITAMTIEPEENFLVLRRRRLRYGRIDADFSLYVLIAFELYETIY